MNMYNKEAIKNYFFNSRKNTNSGVLLKKETNLCTEEY